MSGSPNPLLRVVAATLLAAALGTTVAGAAEETGDTAARDPVELASDGAALEVFLDSAGLGGAWRSATSVGPRARSFEVELDETGVATLSSLITTVDELVEADRERAETSRLIIDASLAIDRAVEREQNATIARNIARHELKVITAILRIVAVDLFEIAYDSDDEMLALEPDVLNQAYRTREITESTVEEMVARKLAAETELARREEALIDAIAERHERENEHAELVEQQGELALTRAGLDDDARRLVVAGAEQWVLTEIVGFANLTPRAVDAYLRAEQAMTVDEPGCRISWATVAAVAAVESRHGTHAGASLLFDGTSDPRIVGIALDGEAVDNYGNPVANIADTDGGRYDDDTVLDRAVGPMQFIPQQWERWARDGDGDGVTNPHDLDDATVSAAAYLCAYGSHRSWVNWNTAVHGYNHSNSYVASVKGNLDRLSRLWLPEIDDGLVWQPTRPAGAYVEPPPDPEPEGEVPAEGEPPTAP